MDSRDVNHTCKLLYLICLFRSPKITWGCDQ